MDKKPLTKKELAERWGCSVRHIERLADNFDDPNKLKETKLGGLVRFTCENVEEFERTHSKNFLFSLPRFTEDYLDELDPAAGTGSKPNFP